MTILFIANSILLGAGLAMDAFSVSMANGLHDPGMSRRKIAAIAGTYAFFQYAMPMAGWLCVHTVVTYYTAFQKCIPWIALFLLAFIGGKMLLSGIRCPEGGEMAAALTPAELFAQGIATSIDALSVGFTISDYGAASACAAALIIAAVTFAISTAGVLIGRAFGTRLSGKADIMGGLILIFIGAEIFVRGVF
ncbi:MAG: manganese efflux pump [Lachnospiraceae bacterium]|nr:manganese efflux pump [Lachnospiraceae bacterium]